jgi:hypothetical protein
MRIKVAILVVFVLGIGLMLVFYFGFYRRVINGYCDKVSYYPGETMSVFLNSSVNTINFTVALYDIQGNKVHDDKGEVIKIVSDIQTQDTLKDRPWESGFNYDLAFTYKIPELKSGLYLWENKVPFIVKARDANIVVLYESNTVNAYNTAGGESLYTYDTITKTSTNTVSFLRPADVSSFSREFLKWIDQKNFGRVGYICDLDMDSYDHFKNAKLLILTGHSEYWTRKARRNFDRFVDLGNDALILAGNTMWWQVRYTDDATKLICYKSFSADPTTDTLLKTITWDQPILDYPIINSIGVEYGRAGFGRKTDNGWDGYKINEQRSPLLEGTGLRNGNIISLSSHELDGTFVKGFDSTGRLVPNNENNHFEKIEIIGYDSVSGFLNDKAIATWIVLKKTKTSGTIVNTATTDWCSEAAFQGRDASHIKKITENMINKSLRKQNLFSN